jgi:hypothetical protein
LSVRRRNASISSWVPAARSQVLGSLLFSAPDALTDGRYGSQLERGQSLEDDALLALRLDHHIEQTHDHGAAHG